MSPRAAVAVTGLGLITPAGHDPETVCKTMAAGRSLARKDPGLADLPVDISCSVTGFDPIEELGLRLASRLDRFAHLALVAGRHAVADAQLDTTQRPERVAVVLGVGANSLQTYVREFTRIAPGRSVSPLALPRSVPSMVAGEVAIDTGARGHNFTVSSACASGTTAIGVARDLLLSGACDVVLTGGCESGRARATAACFARMRALSTRTERPEQACRPFDTDRDGFVLGEGAAVLVLERADHARSRGAHVRAWLRGYGASADAHHPTSPHPQGRGAEQAIRQALSDAGCTPGDVGHINAHGTATRLGDTAEALALLRVFTGAPPAVTSSKSILGHALGAAGAIEAALTVLALQRQEVAPTANLARQDTGREMDIVTGRPRPVAFDVALSTSCGFGGQNAALVLAAS